MPFANVGSGIKPSDGAQLFYFELDGVTPKDTFSDQLSTPTPNTNPVISDSTGVFGDIYISGIYKVTLKDKNGSQIFGGAIVDEFAGFNDLTLPYEFGTVALMVASTIVFPTNKAIKTKGYTTVGDGGQGDYLFQAGSGDGFGSHTSAVSGFVFVLQNFELNTLNARQYGVTGTLDDTQFAAMIAVADAGSGVTIIATDLAAHTFANGLSIDVSKTKIIGNTTTFDFSGSADTFAFDLTGTQSPPREQVLSFLKNIKLLGSGKAGTQSALRLDGNAAPAGPNRIFFEDVYIESFLKAMDIQDNTYLIKFFRGVIRDCASGVTRPDGATNSGENISFWGTLFDGNNFDFFFDYTTGSGTDIYLHSCSLDDTVNKPFHIDAGVRIEMFGCHVEHPSGNWAQTPFFVGDRNGLIVMHGGRIVNPGTGTNPGFIFEVSPRTASAEKLGIALYDVQTANLETSSGFMANGDSGSIIFKNRTFDGLDTSPNLMGEVSNRMADGGFELASIIDDVFKLTGSTNITLAVSAAAPITGAQSLAATHTGNPSKFVISTPVEGSDAFKYEFQFKVTGGTVGGITSKYVKAVLDSSGDLDVKKEQTIVTHGSQTATTATKLNSNNQNQRAPSWATHAIIEFNIDTFGGNTIYVDDVILNVY
jgi:hypothetical protein